MKYDIGDYVIVNSKMIKTVGGFKRCYVPINFSRPKLGRVVGLCRRFEGDYKSSSQGYYGDWEAPYLSITNSKLFWLVKFGWLNKPILCSDECLTLAKLCEIKDFPKLFVQQHNWAEEDRKYLSEDSKNWPRDKKGRWTK